MPLTIHLIILTTEMLNNKTDVLFQFSWHLLGNLLLHGTWLLVTKNMAESGNPKAVYSR